MLRGSGWEWERVRSLLGGFGDVVGGWVVDEGGWEGLEGVGERVWEREIGEGRVRCGRRLREGFRKRMEGDLEKGKGRVVEMLRGVVDPGACLGGVGKGLLGGRRVGGKGRRDKHFVGLDLEGVEAVRDFVMGGGKDFGVVREGIAGSRRTGSAEVACIDVVVALCKAHNEVRLTSDNNGGVTRNDDDNRQGINATPLNPSVLLQTLVKHLETTYFHRHPNLPSSSDPQTFLHAAHNHIQQSQTTPRTPTIYYNQTAPPPLSTTTSPLFPVLFLCLFTGNKEAAKHLAETQKHEFEDQDSAVFWETLDKYFENDFVDVPGGDLMKEFERIGSAAEDCYRRACYVLVAKVDPNATHGIKLIDDDFQMLFDNVSDYILLKLKVCRGVSEEVVGGRGEDVKVGFVSLESVQREVVEAGSEYFDKDDIGGDGSLYAYVLLICGMVGEAVRHLTEKASMISMGLAMYLGVICCYGGVEMRMGIDRKKLVAYAAVVQQFVGMVASVDAYAAAIYAFSVPKTEERNSVLRLVVEESKEFEELLGVGDHAGYFVELAQAMGNDDLIAEMKELTIGIASKQARNAEMNGDLVQAMNLWKISSDKSRERQVLKTLLKDSVGTRNSMRTEIIHEAQELEKVSEADSEILVLLKIAGFWDTLWAGQNTDAWVSAQDILKECDSMSMKGKAVNEVLKEALRMAETGLTENLVRKEEVRFLLDLVDKVALADSINATIVRLELLVSS